MTEYATEEFSVTQLIDAVRPSQMSVAFGPDRSVTQVKKEHAERHTDDDAELNVPSVSQTIVCSTARGSAMTCGAGRVGSPGLPVV